MLGFGVILAPIGGECSLSVHKFAAVEEVTGVVKAVKIEAVGIESSGLAVLEHYVVARFSHLFVAVIKGVVAEKRQGVTLIHLDMTEGFKRVGGFIEVGAVAKQLRSLVLKLHFAVENLRSGILKFIITQLVCMDKIHTVVRHLGLARTLALLCLPLRLL